MDTADGAPGHRRGRRSGDSPTDRLGRDRRHHAAATKFRARVKHARVDVEGEAPGR